MPSFLSSSVFFCRPSHLAVIDLSFASQRVFWFSQEEDLKILLDELLATVATFIPPSAGNPRGYYKLKPEFWKEVWDNNSE